MNNLLMTKSSDCKSDLVKGHASRPYKSTDKHLVMTSAEAIHARSVFENTTFAARL